MTINLNSLKAGITLQSAFYFLVLSVYYEINVKPEEASYFDFLLWYSFGAVFYQLLPHLVYVYLAIPIILVVLLVKAVRYAKGSVYLLWFHICGLLGTVYPWVAYEFGTYRGP